MNTKRNARVLRRLLTAILALGLLAASAWVVAGIFDIALPWGGAANEPPAPALLKTSGSDLPEWSGWQQGTVCVSAADLRTDPGIRAAKVAVLREGDGLAAVAKHRQWLRVRVGTASGWVEESAVELTGEAFDSEGGSSGGESIEKLGRRDAKALDAIAERYRCVGATVAVVEGGEVRYTYEFGYANKAGDVRMTADSKLRTASLSKVMVGMSAMSMRDMGWLSLDEDISEYFGERIFNPYFSSDPITLRYMLTHTSSLREVTEYSNARSLMTARMNYRNGKPGTVDVWSYSNIATGCAGACLEYASGMTLVDFTDGFYFDSMGVDASYYPKNMRDIDLIATLYSGTMVCRTVETQLNRFYTKTPGGNSKLYYGGLVISAKDYARLLCILAGDGSYHGMAYMSPRSAEEMKTPYVALKDFEQCIVLRKRANIYDGRTLHYHTGNATGVLALASFDDETGDGVVVLTSGAVATRDQYGIYAVCGEMTEYCYENVLK